MLRENYRKRSFNITAFKNNLWLESSYTLDKEVAYLIWLEIALPPSTGSFEFS